MNRLTWAGSTGTPSCGTSLTPGTLTSAAYTASYAYDTNNRLTTGPAGTYTDGNSSHVDALTSTGGGYTASYDAAGGHELSRAEQQPDVQRDGDGAEYDV